MKYESLSSQFDPRRNSLNAFRLVLASLVIFRHAVVVVNGSTESSLWVDQIVGALPVDGFFALSGFLIARSWLKDPRPSAFLAARVARIYPAFWFCLFVTALLLRPILAIYQPGNDAGLGFLPEGIRYVSTNATLIMFENDIGGTPVGVPWPSDWNASLWTLKWEFACYVGVMVLGLIGWLKNRRVMFLLLLAAWSAQIIWVATALESHTVDALIRFAFMYLCGVALHLFADVIPVSKVLGVGALFVALVAAAVIPEYRVVGAIPLAYGLVACGTLFEHPRLRLKNDVSYGMYIYGFPVEQLLAGVPAIRDMGPIILAFAALAATAPLAVASWLIVEKPALTWAKRRLNRRQSASSPESVSGAGRV